MIFGVWFLSFCFWFLMFVFVASGFWFLVWFSVDWSILWSGESIMEVYSDADLQDVCHTWVQERTIKSSHLVAGSAKVSHKIAGVRVRMYMHMRAYQFVYVYMQARAFLLWSGWCNSSGRCSSRSSSSRGCCCASSSSNRVFCCVSGTRHEGMM